MNIHYLCLALCLVASIVCGQQNSGGSSSTPLETLVANLTNTQISQTATQNVTVPFLQPWPVRFSYPVDIQNDNNSNWLYVVEQVGTIKAFLTNESIPTIVQFLDIHNLVVFDGKERGLLGLAFDPNYSNNSWFYVCYTNPNIVISRFTATNSSFADPSTEVKIISWVHPFENHNGGQLAFGKDGFLYHASGDGGATGDPLRNAQNMSSPLGKILRIDVSMVGENSGNNTSTGNNTSSGSSPFLIKNYQVPNDNPFTNISNALPEIWAFGFRNPWRFSFDNLTGDLWLGDVGENDWEEIDVINASSNAGWPFLEGPSCYNPPRNCSLVGVQPVFAFNHSANFTANCSNTCSTQDNVAVIGGIVYRGQNISGLNGSYIFAEFFSATILLLNSTSGSPYNNTVVVLGSIPKAQISTFGVDKNGELYFADYKNGFIYGFASPNISEGNVTTNATSTESGPESGTEGTPTAITVTGTVQGTVTGTVPGTITITGTNIPTASTTTETATGVVTETAVDTGSSTSSP